MQRILSTEVPAHVGETVLVAGWVHRIRRLKAVAFLIVRDAAGLTQVVVTDHTGGEILSINTTGLNPPDVQLSEDVEIIGLVAMPWFNQGRAGVAYSADEIKPVAE